jgi:hypothetical protein
VVGKKRSKEGFKLLGDKQTQLSESHFNRVVDLRVEGIL